MKKTINVNIGGYAFIIEEQAYEFLNAYLNSVRANLGTDIDVNEVMNDIEIRIAELFREELRNSGKEVVDSFLIEKVKSIMGSPEEYGNGSGASAEESKKEQHHHHHYNDANRRTLYRDPENRMLGGVCSGLGNYFGWDPIFFRILFVVLFFGFGTGMFIYIILWIIVPVAKSTADKLRMQGKPVNIGTIKERFNDFTKDLENLGNSDNEKKIKNAATSFGAKVENVFSDFGRIITRIVGVVLFVIGIFLCVSLIKYFVSGTVSLPSSASEEFFFGNSDLFFTNRFEYYCLIYGSIVLAALILYGLISTGIELLFNVKLRFKPVRYITTSIAILAITAIIYGGINLGKHFSQDETITKRYEVPLKNNEIEVEILNDKFFSDKLSSAQTDCDELIKVSNTRIVFGYPTLEIKKSENGKCYMQVEKIASGYRGIQAIENCEAIDYPVTVDSSLVALPAVFSTSVKNKFRNQDVITVLYVPENTIIKNKLNMKRIFNPYNSFIGEDELFDAVAYKMTDDGLVKVE